MTVHASFVPLQRPHSVEDLLSEPITDGEDVGRASDPGWELQHGTKRRFYVVGFTWFLRSGAAADAKDLYVNFSTAAVQQATENGWTEMPGSGDLWDELSYNQVRHAQNGVPMFFQKAALIILSCELALAARETKGRKVRIASAFEVYRHMRILPACWNIDDFSKDRLDRIEKQHPGAVERLRKATGQSSPKVIRDLAAGHTVTRKTANNVKAALDDFFPAFAVGRVRAHAGKVLGRKSASESETVDVETLG